MAHSPTFRGGTPVPPVTKGMCSALATVSLFGFYLQASVTPDVVPALAVVPGSALWYFWTFVTANFFEPNPLSLVINAVALLFCGKYLERVWGSREFLVFCAICGVVPMFAAFVYFVIEYASSGNTDYLYAVQARGMTAVLCGFSVAFKHLVPEHTVKLFAGAVSIRVKYSPLAFLALQLIIAAITRSFVQVVLAVSGLMSSWVYIRFIKVQEGIRGDRSEAFSFASFFPEPIQPPVKIISNFTFRILVALRICNPMPVTAGAPFDLEGGISMRPSVRQLHAYQPPSTMAPSGVSSSDQAIADRRRALALKQLDMRLTSQQQQQQQQQTSPPPYPAVGQPLTPGTPAPKQPPPPRAASPFRPTALQPEGQLSPSGGTLRPGESSIAADSGARGRSLSPVPETGKKEPAAMKAASDKRLPISPDAGPRGHDSGSNEKRN